MAFPVTINGNTYAASDFEGYDYLVNFPAIISDIAAEAATVEANAAIAQNAGGLNYKFNTATSDADPTSGKLAVNNATLSSATEFYISETTDSAQDASGFIAYWDESTSATKGYIRIVKQDDLTTFLVLEITGTITDNGGWDKFTVTYVSHNGTFSNNDELTVSFTPSGAKGDAGGAVADGDYGDITISGGGAAYAIDAAAVTNTNLANMAANTVKARVGSTAGVPTDVALSANQWLGRGSTGDLGAQTGASALSYDAGTKTTGTFTPDASQGNIQHYINGGAHTLAPPATTTVITIEVLNNGSAGAITTSGFTLVSGDDLTTTDTHKFILDIRKTNTVSQLVVKAAQ